MVQIRNPQALFGTEDILTPNKRIVSELDINVTIPAASAATALGVGFPMAFNESTGQHAPWIAPDATVVVITLTGATGGTFTITVNSATTSALAFNASAATITAALKAIGYDVSVVKATLVYTLTFDGEAEIITLPTVSADTSLATGDVTESVTVNDGTAQVIDPTILNFDMEDRTGGDFTVTYNGNVISPAIAFGATAPEIAALIVANIPVAPPASVTVTRSVGGNEISIIFDDEADLLSLPTIDADGTGLTGGTGASATVVVGNVLSIASASDVVVDVGTATGGTFTVTVDGLTTAGIDFDATAGEVDTALAAIGFSVTTALVSTAYTITFDVLAQIVTLPVVTGSIAALTGAALTVVETTGTSTNGTHNIRGFIHPNTMQSGTQTGTLALVVLTGSDTVCTATQTTPHSLITGMSITVSGATEAKLNITATITVTTPFSFTYTVAAVAGGTVDSGIYTTTNDIMTLIMVRGTIHATLPEGLVASGDLTALRTALKNDLIEKGITVQGLAGRF